MIIQNPVWSSNSGIQSSVKKQRKIIQQEKQGKTEMFLNKKKYVITQIQEASQENQ